VCIARGRTLRCARRGHRTLPLIDRTSARPVGSSQTKSTSISRTSEVGRRFCNWPEAPEPALQHSVAIGVLRTWLPDRRTVESDPLRHEQPEFAVMHNSAPSDEVGLIFGLRGATKQLHWFVAVAGRTVAAWGPSSHTEAQLQIGSTPSAHNRPGVAKSFPDRSICSLRRRLEVGRVELGCRA
jgi:hypothetical protein